MTKTEKIVNWLYKANNVSYGALHLMGNSVYTYDVTLANVNRTNRTAVVNSKTYSCTSSGHRNRLLDALESAGYNVTFVDGPPSLFSASFEKEKTNG